MAKKRNRLIILLNDMGLSKWFDALHINELRIKKKMRKNEWMRRERTHSEIRGPERCSSISSDSIQQRRRPFFGGCVSVASFSRSIFLIHSFVLLLICKYTGDWRIQIAIAHKHSYRTFVLQIQWMKNRRFFFFLTCTSLAMTNVHTMSLCLRYNFDRKSRRAKMERERANGGEWEK